jgi:4-amino-4-deoxy-L-arabinose transferase
LLLFVTAFPFIVFMLVRSRLPFYILPLFPPLACYAALILGNIDLRATPVRIAGICWCATLVGALWLAGIVNSPNDDRLLARALDRASAVKFSSTAFVQTTPRYGLRFYNDVDIVALNLPGFDGPVGSQLLNSIRFDHGCTALLVNTWNTGVLIETLRAQQRPFRRIDNVIEYAVFLEGGHCA